MDWGVAYNPPSMSQYFHVPSLEAVANLKEEVGPVTSQQRTHSPTPLTCGSRQRNSETRQMHGGPSNPSPWKPEGLPAVTQSKEGGGRLKKQTFWYSPLLLNSTSHSLTSLVNPAHTHTAQYKGNTIKSENFELILQSMHHSGISLVRKSWDQVKMT